MKTRPTGLTVFATVNFLFAGLMFLSLIGLVSTSGQQAQVPVTAYRVVSPLLTAVLLLVSGVGFLRLHYVAGFIGGVAFCVLSLGNILVFNAVNGFEQFATHVPSMVYPTVLLMMLVTRYRPAFRREQ